MLGPYRIERLLRGGDLLPLAATPRADSSVTCYQGQAIALAPSISLGASHSRRSGGAGAPAEARRRPGPRV